MLCHSINDCLSSSSQNLFMKKKLMPFIAGLYFMVACTQAFAQSKTDSLLGRLKNAGEDTSRVHLLNQLSSALYFVNPDSTILLANGAAKLSEKLNFKRGEGDAYHNLGIGHYIKGDYPNAIEAYLKAIEIRKRIGQIKETGSDLGNIALIYTDQGDYVKSLEYNFKALKIAVETGNKKL